VRENGFMRNADFAPAFANSGTVRRTSVRPAAPHVPPALWATARRGSHLVRTAPFLTFGMVLSSIAAITIVVNAVFLQTIVHPAPMFDTVPIVQKQPLVPKALPPAPIAQREPVVSPVSPPETSSASINDLLTTASVPHNEPVREPIRPTLSEPRVEPKRDAIGDLLRQGKVEPRSSSNASAPLERDKILAVQRALVRAGYKDVTADGVFGATTRAALERFERDKRLNVTGSLQPRTLRELERASGVPLRL
jgi:Putative peptidoglycan binding domain